MEYFMMPTEKISALQQFKKTEKDVIGGLCSLANIPLSPETAQDQERRIRREIANSNERRRMQSINAGFQSLKTLLPHTDGEKLSKAAILQQTAEYIFTLEQEKTQLLAQNNQLKRFIQEFSGSSPKRRRAEEKDEGIGSPDTMEEEKMEELRREILELRQKLDKERSARMQVEDEVRSLDTRLRPEHLKVITQHMEEEQAILQSQTLLRLQQVHAADRTTPSPQHPQAPAPPAPTHHPTVIVPAPALTQHSHHHVTVVTASPSVYTSTMSTSRQNLDTIVQAIQHIERTQERRASAEEEQRRAVIVSPAHIATDTACSDTDTDTEGED
uniref:Transcription factor AP-4 n=1 Tax=Tetraodon nigroviridis TaxID=99883 RepID=H3D9B2_TETNG